MSLTRGEGNVALTPSERTLLAALAVAGGRVVGIDHLAEWMWSGREHASARNRIQALVSGLRRKCAPDEVVVTHEAGYRLADSVWCDLSHRHELMNAAASAHTPAAQRRNVLHQADDLATGEPLAGLSDNPTIEARRRQLSEESLEISAQRIAADLEHGCLDGLASTLQRLTEEHPFHEQLHALLLRTLARGGRQAEALTIYREVHARLDEHLGVRPGPILAAAHAAVLAYGQDDLPEPRSASGPGPQPEPRRDSTPTSPPHSGSGPPPTATGWAPSPPRSAPRSVGTFIGRDTELSAILVGAVREGGTAPVVAVTGRGGMGKTTLAVEAAHRLRDAFPDGTLYLNVASETGRAGVSQILAHFLHLLGVPTEHVPAEREARVATYRSILDTKRVLVVLDDIPSGLDLSDLLPSRAPSAAILTSRQTLARCEPTTSVIVGALDDGCSERLLGCLINDRRVDEDHDGLRALVRECCGLPLLIRITAQRLAARPDLTLNRAATGLSREISGHGGDSRTERALYAGLGLSEEPLSPAARTVLGRFAALPLRAASRWLLSSLVCDGGDAAVDELHAAYLLETETLEGNETQFTLHDLVRLHAASGADASGVTDAGHIAQTLLVTAIPYAQAYPSHLLPLPADSAGRRAQRYPSELDPHDSLGFFRTEQETFLWCAREVSDFAPELSWRLLALLGIHADAGIDTERWLENAARVRSQLDAAAADDRRGLCHLDLVEAYLRHEAADSRSAAVCANRAHRSMVLDGDTHGAAVAAVLLGRAHRANGERHIAEAALEWAVNSATELDAPGARAYAALAWGSLLDDYDELTAAREHLIAATELFAELGDWAGAATAQFALARVHRRLGDFELGLPLCDGAMDLLARLGGGSTITAVLDTRADILVQMGEPHAALPTALAAVDQAVARQDAFIRHRAQRTLGRVYAALGELEPSEHVLRESSAGFERLGRPLSLAASLHDLGRVLELQGRGGEARDVFASERACLVRSGLTDTADLDATIARLDRRLGTDSGVA